MSHALLPACFVLLSCGAAFRHPECKKAYDDCMNACASRCEERAVEATDRVVSTWDAACQGCTDGCRDRADECDDRTGHR